MAESVDALVSNTSGETRPGSTPGLGTQERQGSPRDSSLPLSVYPHPAHPPQTVLPGYGETSLNWANPIKQEGGDP